MPFIKGQPSAFKGRKHSKKSILKMKTTMSKNNHGKWMIGKKMSSKTKQKISQAKLGVTQSEEFKQKRKDWCKNNKTILSYAGIKGAKAASENNGPTNIELIVYNFLKRRNIKFEKQYLINNKFLVDAFIPQLNLIIECDGKYWHNMKHIIKKDKAENAYLKKCGYKLIRLTEKEILNGKFKLRLEI